MKKQKNTWYSRIIKSLVVWIFNILYAERHISMAEAYVQRWWILRILPFRVALFLVPIRKKVNCYCFGGSGYIMPCRRLRFKLYQAMLDIYMNDPMYKASLCASIKKVLRQRFAFFEWLPGVEDVATIFTTDIVYYPEIEAYRPDGRRRLFWFPLNADGRKERIKILKSILKTKYTSTNG